MKGEEEKPCSVNLSAPIRMGIFFHRPCAMPKFRLPLVLFVSALLHALILAGLGRWGVGALPLPEDAPLRVLRMVLAPTKNQTSPPAVFSSPAGAVSGKMLAPPLDEHPRSPVLRHDKEPEARFSVQSAPPSLPDMESLREQARQLAREQPATGLFGSRKTVPEPSDTPDLLDRPILEALSRRIGKPLLVLSEQVLQDGTRRIRFSGNVCLDIPRHLNPGQETPFLPTMLVTKSCAD